MKFEEAGRALDLEVAKLGDLLNKKLRPATRQEMVALLRRASSKLAKMATDLEKDEPGTSG